MTQKCAVCGAEMSLADVKELGDIVECEECGAQFEVINLEPIELEEIVEEAK